MRAVVFGNLEFGCVGLEELLAMEVEVPLVVTYPPRPDRGPEFRFLSEVAAERGIPVATPPDASGRPLLDWIRGLRPDILFSFHYDHRIPPTVRAVPRLGAYNFHESLLPRWRGRAPIPFVILGAEKESGVTLHAMEEEFDSGDVVGQVRFPVAPRETATTLYAKSLAATRLLLRRAVPLLLDERAPHGPQDRARATVTPATGPRRLVDRSATVERFDRTVRAFASPYAGARVPLGGETVVAWEGEPGEEGEGIPLRLADGVYRILRLNFEGEPALDWKAFLGKNPDAPAALGKPRPPFTRRAARKG